MDAVTVKRQRADRGDGSVKQVQTGKHKGRWRARLTYRDKWNRTQDVDKLLPTQREAKAFLKQFKSDIEKGKENNQGYTLGEWFDWLKVNDWPDNVKASTISYRVFRFEKYTRPILGDLHISKIRPMMVKDFYKEIERLKAGANTIAAVKNDLVNMTNKAIAYEIHDGSNPFAIVKVDTPELRAGVALTPAKAKYSLLRMAAAVRRGELEPWPLMFATIALCAGLRRGELLALSEEQFDFAQGLLTVDRAVIVLDKGRQEMGLPKKDKVRSVVLSNHLAKWVQSYIEQTKGERGDCKLLFPSGNSKPIQVRRLRTVWAKACKLAKFPAGMILHDTRLTHNTWIEKLMPQVSDSTRLAHMGHAATGVNLRYYTRELSPAMDELRKGLDELINKAG